MRKTIDYTSKVAHHKRAVAAKFNKYHREIYLQLLTV
jgi:hypothetical protein